MKKNSCRARTIRLASFVPVFVAATLSVVYFFHINYYKKTLVIVIKKRKMKN